MLVTGVELLPIQSWFIRWRNWTPCTTMTVIRVCPGWTEHEKDQLVNQCVPQTVKISDSHN